MRDRILVSDRGIYVNNRLPCLKKYKGKVLVIKTSPSTDAVNSKQASIDVSEVEESSNLADLKAENQLGVNIYDHADKIIDTLVITKEDSFYMDVVILCDINPDMLYVMDVIRRSDFRSRLHLIFPLPFGRVPKNSVQHDLLADMSKVTTLAVYDPYELAMKKYGNTDTASVEAVVNEQTKHLLGKLEEQEWKMDYRYDYLRYFFDFNKDSYIDTDSLYIIDDFEIEETLGRLYDPYLIDSRKEENDYFIKCLQVPVPRSDGKVICTQLRSIRKEFARINGIDFKFKECDYDGPCAGTCHACDAEARQLKEMADKMGNCIYPSLPLEDCHG